MSHFHKLIFALAAMIMFASATPSAKAGPSECDNTPGNLVTNCGFETFDFTGWTVSSSAFGVTNIPHSGTFALFFENGGAPGDGFLTQQLTTIAGHTYTISFFLDNSSSPANDFTASFNGVPGVSLINAPDFRYTLFTFTGVATGTATRLQFAFQNFWRLDDVVVLDNGAAATPEPATMLLLGTGLVGAVGVIRRRRRVQA